MPFFTLSSKVGIRASGFIGRARTVINEKPFDAQEIPMNAAANTPTAHRMKRDDSCELPMVSAIFR